MGDPAQTLPIGDHPIWSTINKNETNKGCCQESINGLVEFRPLFGMPTHSIVKGYADYHNLSQQKPKKEKKKGSEDKEAKAEEEIHREKVEECT